jgi:hypothetical protein
MPPTALKMMRQVKDPKTRYTTRCTIGCGRDLGEELRLGKEVI